jgi:hypothetical protein
LIGLTTQVAGRPFNQLVVGSISSLHYPAPPESPGFAFLRFAIPLRLEAQSRPSVPSSFVGHTVHWTVCVFRLTLGEPARRRESPPDIHDRPTLPSDSVPLKQ